jgi:hypothetical protein
MGMLSKLKTILGRRLHGHNFGYYCTLVVLYDKRRRKKNPSKKKKTSINEPLHSEQNTFMDFT